MTRLVVGAVALLLALAGCGGEPKAEPSASPSTTAVSTAPSPTPPVMPEAAKAETKAGAMAFVRHYVELVNHAQATGDIDELQSAEQAGCRSCRAAREGVRKHYQSGGSINGGDWHIDSASAIRNAAIAGWVVDLNVTFGRQTISFGSSQPDKVNEPGRMILSIQVHRSDDAWKVLEWTRGS